MARRHMTLELKSETARQLDAASRGTGQTPAELAEALLEDGLRMRAHPGIVFRSGPAGRRPGLAGGPDIWEVVRVLRAVRPQGQGALRRAADLTGLTTGQVEIAARYYAAYPEEIDAWLRRVDEEAERDQEPPEAAAPPRH